MPSGAHVEQGEGLRDVVRVHGVEDDGGRGEEGEQEDEEEVEDEAARPPAHTLHREILPGAEREGRRTGGNVVSSVRTGNDHTGRCFNSGAVPIILQTPIFLSSSNDKYININKY